MKKLHLILLAATTFFLAAGNLQAQERKVLSEEEREEIVENAKINLEKLALTDEQKPSYKAINQKYAEKLKTLKLNEEDRRTKLKAAKAIQEEKNAEMKTLLNEAQYKTYLEMQAERRNKLKERRKN